MRYKLNDEVVYSKVCNVHLLITTRKAWDKLDPIKRLSPIQGCFCYGIERGMSDEEIISGLILPEGLSRDVIHKRFESFINSMTEKGYVIPLGDDND
ncbi:MAG: hypothetical protein IKR03_00530 [Clostridia bacterium]|nr:hypothetical protein [Clostridia bacterium]